MTMRNQSQADQTPRHAAAPLQEHTSPARKPFVEPAISSPVDVLAATTFFQVVDSGGTLGRRPRF